PGSFSQDQVAHRSGRPQRGSKGPWIRMGRLPEPPRLPDSPHSLCPQPAESTRTEIASDNASISFSLAPLSAISSKSANYITGERENTKSFHAFLGSWRCVAAAKVCDRSRAIRLDWNARGGTTG